MEVLGWDGDDIPDAAISVYTIVLCALFANRRPTSIIRSMEEVDCANRAARACARSRSTFSFGVSGRAPPGPDEEDCVLDSAMKPGSLYGADPDLELA